jgi:hypothetical protein
MAPPVAGAGMVREGIRIGSIPPAGTVVSSAGGPGSWRRWLVSLRERGGYQKICPTRLALLLALPSLS